MKKLKIIAVCILVIIVLAWIYYIPIQRFMAEKSFEKYSTAQGVTSEDIATKEVYKDYKQGGYFILVTYHSDPSHKYQYHYFLIDRRNWGVGFDTMYCDVFDSNNNQLDDYAAVVYKPLQ